MRATFFVQGRWAEAQPELARSIADDGHLIGLHSFYHARMPLLHDEGIATDVQDGHRAVLAATGRRPPALVPVSVRRRPRRSAGPRRPRGPRLPQRVLERGARGLGSHPNRRGDHAMTRSTGCAPTATVPSSCSTRGPEARPTRSAPRSTDSGRSAPPSSPSPTWRRSRESAARHPRRRRWRLEDRRGPAPQGRSRARRRPRRHHRLRPERRRRPHGPGRSTPWRQPASTPGSSADRMPGRPARRLLPGRRRLPGRRPPDRSLAADPGGHGRTARAQRHVRGAACRHRPRLGGRRGLRVRHQLLRRGARRPDHPVPRGGADLRGLGRRQRHRRSRAVARHPVRGRSRAQDRAADDDPRRASGTGDRSRS